MIDNPAAQEEIARLAFQIYEAEGCPEGHSDEHWAKAERCWREQRMPVPDKKTDDSETKSENAR